MENFKNKIVTVEELINILGPLPRIDKTVIMCHGVFDVVHPGHLRHLLYAKSKASILVASLTADVHIDKGHYRPHVPQELRALNLAAYEFIDFVLIDQNATPLENLRKIQPNYYAKGYEYTSSNIQKKTQEEITLIKSFGGEMIFTPGDVVYSSSKLINLEPPSIKLEKLVNLMELKGITFLSLKKTLDNFNKFSIHVVGDTIVDSFTHAAMIGGQTKTPTMSVLYDRREDYVGGAGIVARHLKAAGASVIFSTVLGSDSFGEFVIESFKESDIDCNFIIDKTRPTTNKNAIISGGYRLLKIDTLDNRSISDDILDSICKSISNKKADAIVFSDFRHGIFNRRTIPELIDAIPSGVFKVADSQVASRWGNITDFKEFDLLTPNEREARFSLGDQDSGIRGLASQLYDEAKCKTLILKMGERGVMTSNSSNHEALDSFIVVDSFVEHLIDAVGAGDALLAYATLGKMASGSDVIATILGSVAAACACEVDGNIPITRNQVVEKICKIEKQVNYVSR